MIPTGSKVAFAALHNTFFNLLIMKVRVSFGNIVANSLI